MSGTVAELRDLLKPDGVAGSISNLLDTYHNQRATFIAEYKERRDFIYATDTSRTTNSSLPWKNSTTRPKLTTIRDNLIANYMRTLFSSDEWMAWVGDSLEDDEVRKRMAIEAYINNKVRESGYLKVMELLLIDYVEWGNCFADVTFVNEKKTDPVSGEEIPGYVGPKVVRYSPFDFYMNPTAPEFRNTTKIVRHVKHIGEVMAMIEDNPDQGYLQSVLDDVKDTRMKAGSFSTHIFDKAVAYDVDGFGSYQEYLGSDYVELLELEGDIYDPDTGTLQRDRVVTIVDRTKVLRNEPFPSWKRGGYKMHSGWRKRADNLYAMGPLDNLVGLQYRIDHLENLKADALDLSVMPPLKVIGGGVDPFKWGPGARINITDNESDVVEMGLNLNGVITAANDIDQIEAKMEEYAGAPRSAMGIRTPGEKTAFEVQELSDASALIFKEKVAQFERDIIEPSLNYMLEVARRSMDGTDIARVFDDDLGVEDFMSITKEDITAKGKIRPTGAKHFLEKAKLIQELTGISNTRLWEVMQQHVSSKGLTRLIEDTLGLNRFQIFSDNAAVFEQADTQRVATRVQEDLAVEETIDTEGEEV